MGVDLLKSKLTGKLAVGVCDLVHGGDGGPWTVLQSWELDPRVLGETAKVDLLRLTELRRLRRTVRELGRGGGPSAVEAYVRRRHPELFPAGRPYEAAPRKGETVGAAGWCTACGRAWVPNAEGRCRSCGAIDEEEA